MRVWVGRSCAWLAFLASVCWLSTAGESAGQATAQRAQPTPSATVTLFGSATPRMRAVGARRAAELGVVFRSSRAGEIIGIRFFKGPGNHGRHSGTLWSSSGRKLAKAAFTGETASGWQSVRFATPVAIKAGTTYIASYHSSRGRFARMGSGFRTRKVSGPLIAIGSRYAYGPRTRVPNRSDRRAVYYVDVIFAPASDAALVSPPTATPIPSPTATPTATLSATPTVIPTATPTATPEGGLPPLGQPSCVTGAVNVTTASAVASNLTSGNNVCITADVGDVSLDSGAWTSSAVEYLGTAGSGRIGILFLNGVVGLNIRVRANDIGLYDSQDITVEQSRLGGDGPTSRVGAEALDLRDVLDGCDDCIIRDNDIGWMHQDETSGNSGFCVRMTGDNDNLQVVRNKIHDCESDGINGIGGDNVLVDRNEIGPAGTNPACPFGDLCDHADTIQVTGRDGTVTISNNWIHDEGFFTDASGTLVSAGAASGTTYIHGDNGVPQPPILYENNLVENSRGRVEVCGLGTGGTSNSDVTIRNNTFYNLSQAFGIEGFRWNCDSGTNNLIENNVMADLGGGGFHDSGVARMLSNNITGSLSVVTLDADGNCTSANCTGAAPGGFRKPSGVHW